jgi:nitronate monooxygenase
MAYPQIPLTSLLGIRYPLIQAPMAGITTPELVAAVSERGGLGSLGGALLPAHGLRAQIRAVRAQTDAPFNVNLFAPLEVGDPGGSIERMQALLEPWRKRFGLETPKPPSPLRGGFDDALAVVLEEKPPVFSFTFGIPPPEALDSLREAGIKVLGTATTVAEAQQLEDAGCDAIVAQGAEAGGHRGTFDSPFEAAMIGTVALVPLIADHVSCPVVAAGGIMDGRGVVATLALGAAAAQLGTAFLACEESAAPPPYKESLSHVRETDTTVTAAFTGRPLRAIRTRLIEEIEETGAKVPPFPLQAALLADLREAGTEQGELDVVARLAGQGVPLIRTGSAAEITDSLVAEAEVVLQRLSR